MTNKYFPITTETACRLKWSWSTLYLNSGITGSCHRSSLSTVDVDNFENFHNTDKKIQSREAMLAGQWPGDGCEYCKTIEEAGGMSDRLFQNQVPDVYPRILDSNPQETRTDPAVLEVFFSNTCNLKCVYCTAKASSSIQAENKKFGGAIIERANFEYQDNQYKKLAPKFWQWFEKNSQKVQRLQVLGGEPFLQNEVNTLLTYFNNNPHPDLEFNVVTNLSLPTNVIEKTLRLLSELVDSKKVKRVDIQVSIDCWGPAQEYIRNGLQLTQFEKNLKLLIGLKNLRIGLLSTVTSLSIPNMMDLCIKYQEWNQLQTIFWYNNLVLPYDDSVFDPTIFDYSVFESYFLDLDKLLPDHTWDDKITKEKFVGIRKKLEKNCQTNIDRQKELFRYLTMNDQRRNSDWRITFPWLEKVFKENHVV